MAIGYKQQSQASVTLPPNGSQYTFIDAADGKLKRKDSTGAVVSIEDVASGVNTFNTRNGDVVPVAGDYTAAQVDFAPNGNLIATDVQDAIEELDAEKAPITHVGAAGVAQHPVVTAFDAGFMSQADKIKLDTVENGATANHTNSYLLNRAHHTNTQLANTISDFDTAADARVSAGITTHEAALDPHPQYSTQAEVDARINFFKGAVSGIAPLDINQKVPVANLPDSIVSGNIDGGNAFAVFGGTNNIDGGGA
jgi:hypothetical protein